MSNITAKEALELSQECIDKNIEPIFELIKIEAGKGKVKLLTKFSLDDLVVAKLRELGYNVYAANGNIDSRGESNCYIDWSNPKPQEDHKKNCGSWGKPPKDQKTK